MKLSQLQVLAEDAVRAEGHRQAARIIAVNLGSHGKKGDIERVLRELTGGGRQRQAQATREVSINEVFARRRQMKA